MSNACSWLYIHGFRVQGKRDLSVVIYYDKKKGKNGGKERGSQEREKEGKNETHSIA
jgi:hypothetical protein